MSVTESVPRRGTLYSGSIQVHIRPLERDPDCAFMAITGSHGDTFPLPEPDIVDKWLITVAQWGYARVRTNALNPGASATLRSAGFDVVQELTLLSLTHWTPTLLPQVESVTAKKSLRFGSIRPRLRRDIVALDQRAFGATWGLDEGLFSDAITATSHSQVFITRDAGTLTGFVVVGVTGDTGYIQRLAVSPDARRRNIATSLVSTAIRWTQTRRCTRTVVNTEVTNVAALGLYEKIGFVALPDRLTVLQKELR